MRTRNFASIAAFLLCVGGVAFADRPLERTEILQIFQKLTNQPRKTWIPAGTIKATHEEYRVPKTTNSIEINNQISQKIAEYQSNLSKQELTEELQKMKLDAISFNVRYELANEYRMNSTVTVRFDGDRFYWEINVNSRTDSVKPGKDLSGNFMTEQFDLGWNGKRIFAWDGERYTTYFLPGNHAIVDATGKTPHVVNGPLTAGIIPWGYGYYTYENLSVMDSSAVEKYIGGQTQIHLTLNNPDGSQMVFAMDPQKDYAIISCLITGHGGVVISKHYSDYQSIADNWVPSAILLEQYEAESNRLLARDLWDIISIDANTPKSYDFEVSYETDALIEHFSFRSGEPQMYRYSQRVDTDLLLAERLAFAASESAQPQNCATAALKYVFGQLGKDVSGKHLAQLVNEPDKSTNLYQMKKFAQGIGLYCRAVKTDVQTLKGLSGCKVILYVPGKKHFVALEAIDDQYVWTVDLANNKFYYRTDIDFFGMDWTDGTALLISNNPIKIRGNSSEIEDAQLGSIIGAAGYSCTKLLQGYNVVCCSYVGGLCGGMYQMYFTRYGCERAETGSCSSTKMVRYVESLCIQDPYDLFACTVTDEWTSYYMRACE